MIIKNNHLNLPDSPRKQSLSPKLNDFAVNMGNVHTPGINAKDVKIDNRALDIKEGIVFATNDEIIYKIPASVQLLNDPIVQDRLFPVPIPEMYVSVVFNHNDGYYNAEVAYGSEFIEYLPLTNVYSVGVADAVDSFSPGSNVTVCDGDILDITAENNIQYINWLVSFLPTFLYTTNNNDLALMYHSWDDDDEEQVYSLTASEFERRLPRTPKYENQHIRYWLMLNLLHTYEPDIMKMYRNLNRGMNYITETIPDFFEKYLEYVENFEPTRV